MAINTKYRPRQQTCVVSWIPLQPKITAFIFVHTSDCIKWKQPIRITVFFFLKLVKILRTVETLKSFYQRTRTSYIIYNIVRPYKSVKFTTSVTFNDFLCCRHLLIYHDTNALFPTLLYSIYSIVCISLILHYFFYFFLQNFSPIYIHLPVFNGS